MQFSALPLRTVVLLNVVFRMASACDAESAL
jgi:hypothetical protein